MLIYCLLSAQHFAGYHGALNLVLRGRLQCKSHHLSVSHRTVPSMRIFHESERKRENLQRQEPTKSCGFPRCKSKGLCVAAACNLMSSRSRLCTAGRGTIIWIRNEQQGDTAMHESEQGRTAMNQSYPHHHPSLPWGCTMVSLTRLVSRTAFHCCTIRAALL